MVGGPFTNALEVIKKSQTEIWGVPLPPNMIEKVQLHLLTSGKEKIENSNKKNLFKHLRKHTKIKCKLHHLAEKKHGK